MSSPASLTKLLRSFSISAPPLPITIPGRAVYIITLTFSPARSIATRLNAAFERRFSTNFLICKSLSRIFA
jgi:hypothetical protein